MSILYTDRLTLRPFEENDAPAMYRNWTYDGRVAKYCRWYPHESFDATKALLKMYLEQAAQGFEYRWAILLNGSNEPIGAIDVVGIEDDGKSAEIGYVLLHDYWNKGYISEALAKVINELFNNGFTKIIAKHHIDNIASGRVMKKCGMCYTHDGKEETKFGSDELSDVKYYQICKKEKATLSCDLKRCRFDASTKI